MGLSNMIKKLGNLIEKSAGVLACGLYIGGAPYNPPKISLPDVRLETKTPYASAGSLDSSVRLDIRVPYSAFRQSPTYFPPLGPNLLTLGRNRGLENRIVIPIPPETFPEVTCLPYPEFLMPKPRLESPEFEPEDPYSPGPDDLFPKMPWSWDDRIDRGCRCECYCPPPGLPWYF